MSLLQMQPLRFKILPLLPIGFLLGIQFPSHMEAVSLASALLGMATGFVAGKFVSLMAAMDGMASGLMSGLMGAMLGVMSANPPPLIILIHGRKEGSRMKPKWIAAIVAVALLVLLGLGKAALHPLPLRETIFIMCIATKSKREEEPFRITRETAPKHVRLRALCASSRFLHRS